MCIRDRSRAHAALSSGAQRSPRAVFARGPRRAIEPSSSGLSDGALVELTRSSRAGPMRAFEWGSCGAH
eukprot:4134900-Alexandrium_andersonii.AAC.1